MLAGNRGHLFPGHLVDLMIHKIFALPLRPGNLRLWSFRFSTGKLALCVCPLQLLLPELGQRQASTHCCVHLLRG